MDGAKSIAEGGDEQYERAADLRASLLLPSFAFDPCDPWAQAFRRGLAKAGLREKTVFEVGIGVGLNVAFLLELCGAAFVYGSDRDPRMAEVARRNMATLCRGSARTQCVKLFEQAVDLIDAPDVHAALEHVDTIVACIPQVAARHELEWQQGDLAHYYRSEELEAYPFNELGLGLNQRLLQSSRLHAPHSDLILVLNGRVRFESIERLFEASGYQPELLHEELVPQCGATSLDFFCNLEALSAELPFAPRFVCEFYADPDGKVPISACAARTMQEHAGNDRPYHKVYVVRGIAPGR